MGGRIIFRGAYLMPSTNSNNLSFDINSSLKPNSTCHPYQHRLLACLLATRLSYFSSSCIRLLLDPLPTVHALHSRAHKTHVVTRENPPASSRNSRRMVCAHSTSAPTRRPRARQICGRRALIWQCRPSTCLCLEVLCHREPPRRARRMCIPRDLLAPPPPTSLLFPPHVEAPPAITAHISSTARDIRAGMPVDGRERRAAFGMLQDAGLALHVRAHPARGPPARDERAVRIRAPSELQRRRARRRRHAPRALSAPARGGRGRAGSARSRGRCMRCAGA
ncbi:hypothetical protein EDB83DRAFT_1844231 [Lactarius deliciosus]|nr:hypothetical protein EDB83DRAFT_1844231 [Lactarius deliciosus]